MLVLKAAFVVLCCASLIVAKDSKVSILGNLVSFETSNGSNADKSGKDISDIVADGAKNIANNAIDLANQGVKIYTAGSPLLKKPVIKINPNIGNGFYRQAIMKSVSKGAQSVKDLAVQSVKTGTELKNSAVNIVSMIPKIFGIGRP